MNIAIATQGNSPGHPSQPAGKQHTDLHEPFRMQTLPVMVWSDLDHPQVKFDECFVAAKILWKISPAEASDKYHIG